MDIVIPVITFIVGAIGGFAGGVFYLRKQMTNMSMDNKQLQQMAKQMGVNLNQKQLNQMNRKMKNVNPKGKKK